MLAFLLLVDGVGHASPLSRQLARQRQVATHIGQVQEQLQIDQGQMKGVLSQLSGLDQSLAGAQARLASAQGQATAVARQVASDQSREQALQRRLRQRRVLLGRRLREIHEQGTLGYLDVLLGAHSFATFLTRLSWVEEVVGGDVAFLRRTRSEQHSLRAVQAQLQGEEGRLLALIRGETRRRQELAATQAQRRQVLATLETDHRLREAALAQLEQEQAQISQLVQRLETRGGTGIGGIRFIWPTAGPITSPFGMRIDPILHRPYFHTGIDIGAPYGQKVVAAAAGRVLVAGWVNGFGNTVIIDDGGGVTTLYGHAEKLLVQTGEEVAQGQPISLVGATGWATGPHLHFQIMIGGRPVNPLLYLP